MIVAVLLLLASLLTAAVQAAPVPTQLTTSAVKFAGSDVTARASVNHGNQELILPDGHHNPPHFDCGLDNSCPFSPSHHHASKLVEREQGEPVVLERKSFLRHLGHTISHATHSVAHTVKSVKHFVQHSGGKILKVGLKIAATAGEAASKVAQFIPGLGPVAGKVLEKGGEKLNTASDAIHEHIGGNLGKAMHTMDEAQKIVHYIPRDVDPFTSDIWFE